MPEAAAHVASATEATAHVATAAEPTTMASATPAATRRRDVRSNSDQRGNCQQSDHRFTQHY
jgi:spore germination protein GerM